MKKIVFISMMSLLFTSCSLFAPKKTPKTVIVLTETQNNTTQKEQETPAKKTLNSYKKPLKKKKKPLKPKHTHKKSKKSTYEPYSLEEGNSDPELLGPQTTLEKNPLKKEKETKKKKS